MNYLGIDYDIKNTPVLDEGFIPFGVWMRAYLEGADRPVSVAVERENGLISVRSTFIRGDEFAEANLRYVERFVKFMLWSTGGFRIYLCGCDDIAAKLAEAYSAAGERAFDFGFVDDVYEKPLEVVVCSEADFPAANEAAKPIGGHKDRGSHVPLQRDRDGVQDRRLQDAARGCDRRVVGGRVRGRLPDGGVAVHQGAA